MVADSELLEALAGPTPSSALISQGLPATGRGVNLNLILVVDDDPITRRILSRCLQSGGYEVIEAETGERAIELLLRHSPALLLLDYQMPGLSGLDVCRHLQRTRSKFQYPIIIFLTAMDRAEDKVEGFECGAADYLTKPVDGTELLARIRSQLERAASRTMLNERLRASEATNAAQSCRLQDIQSGQKLLLTEASAFPDLKLAIHFAPAHEAGGDFYEIAQLDEDEYGLLLTDVSGHDLSVPFITGALKALSVTFLRGGLSSIDSLTLFDASLRRFLPSELFVTGCYARFNRTTMQLEVVSAGHPPALFQPVAQPCRWIESVGDVLGMHERPVFESSVHTISPGDRLFLYTDGLIAGFCDEHGVRGRSLHGMNRLESLVDAHRGHSIQACVQAVVGQFEHDNPDELEDDVVLMGIEF